MTLDQFIAAKPAELRLGQHFVNSYWECTDSTSQYLYQLDGIKARLAIQQIMRDWHWDSLPEASHKQLKDKS